MRSNIISTYLSTCVTLIVFLGFCFIAQAQEVRVTGTIQDSLTVLPNANILAKPASDSLQMSFAISDQKGEYTLLLKGNTTYELSIRYLGYQPQNITLTTSEENLIKDFLLQPSTNELDEVVLNYKIPLVVKEDTLIYSVESFTDGSERKLREVLKKLPGVEVDKAGNVTVKGKKVTKVLVEDKVFFTGDSKLAVNNIPADAVNKVEVLDNYSEIPFLKGLQDSDEMAMNIKLKEDKKNFAFGDVEVGGGHKDRYLIHPTLFYYSPETNLNFIGDLNNIGIKSFSFQDYLDFEGGFSKLLNEGGSYFNLYNDDFARYLNNQDYRENTNRFGAFNFRRSVTGKTDLNAYVIVSDTDTETEIATLNEYISEPNFLEARSNTNQLQNTFLLGKISLDYEPSYEEDLSLDTSVKLTNNRNNGFISTVNPFQSNEIQTIANAEGLSLTQRMSYSRKFDRKHTGTVEANLQYTDETPTINWLTNQQILQGIIPLEEDEVYNIFQSKRNQSTTFDAVAKEYWVLNNYNHIYTSFGVNLLFNNFTSEESQRLSNGNLNAFDPAGFGNDISYHFSDVFAGLEYKFQRGIFIFKPALFYHFYNWQTIQPEDRTNQTKGLLLPRFTFKAEIKNSEKVNFTYGLRAGFPSVNQLANRFILQSFNSVFRGNQNLDNTLYHAFSLNYFKFSLYKDLMVNGRMNYNRRVRNIKNQTVLNGIEQFSTPVILENPENNFSVSGNLSKKINTLKYNVKARYNYNDFFQIVNDQTTKNQSSQVSATASINTYFNKHWPDFEIGYTKEFNRYQSPLNTSNFENDEFFVTMDYIFLKDFVLTSDYTRSEYTNETAGIKNMFDVANASLFYQKEDSPWGFELGATNLFNVQFKQSNSFSDFLISDQRTFILPRILLFKVVYKL